MQLRLLEAHTFPNIYINGTVCICRLSLRGKQAMFCSLREGFAYEVSLANRDFCPA